MHFDEGEISVVSLSIFDIEHSAKHYLPKGHHIK